MKFQYEPIGDEIGFQTFLKDLFNAVYSTETFEEYGSKGNKQDGIDIYSPKLKIGIQAKKKDINRNKKTVVNELLNELAETLEQIKDFPFPIEQLFFATTLKKDITLQQACINGSLTDGINVTLFSWDDIQNQLPYCPSVRNRYFPHLQPAKKRDIQLFEKIEKLEKMILKNNIVNLPVKKQFRNIPHCEVLFPILPDDLQKLLIQTMLKIALYETFKETVYKKFSSLIYFSKTYTQFSDGSEGPGFQIISGEVVFLSKCSSLVKELQNNSPKFWERIEKYENDLNFRNTKFRMELLGSEDLNAYEFEIDGQTQSYNIRALQFENLDYDNLSSLSAVLPFIARMTKPAINIIELDKIKSNSAFMKLFYHYLNENSFRPTLLKINVDDFDDWDYEYKPLDD